MHIRSSEMASHLIRAAAIASLVIVSTSLTGCSYLRKQAGVTRSSPDEFSVLTKGSLVIPPDFGLMPPKPGEPPTNQSDPSTSAQSALYGGAQNAEQLAATMPGNGSKDEKLLLAKAGAATADPQIRAHLAADVKGTLVTDDGFVNQVLFWKDKKPKDKGTPVNAAAENARRDQQKQTGEKAAPANEADDSGWFDGWFDWL